jgi:hypothetical protein
MLFCLTFYRTLSCIRKGTSLLRHLRLYALNVSRAVLGWAAAMKNEEW